MSDAEESSAQRQARIRREKREAKIKSGGHERLEKITKLSGRTPESLKTFDSPAATPPRTASPAALPTPPPMDSADPEQLRRQEEFIRAMLRNQQPQPQQQQPGQSQEAEDPMMKMLSQMLGGMNSDPNNPNASEGGLPSLNPDDIAKATGLPSFVTNMMMGKQETPPDPKEVKSAQFWKLIHVVFSVVAGLYMLLTVDKLTSTFGENPPAPATAQNPFVIFVMAELLLHGLKTFSTSSSSGRGFGFWLQTAKDIGRDGAIMVFLMGAYNWWNGLA